MTYLAKITSNVWLPPPDGIRHRNSEREYLASLLIRLFQRNSICWDGVLVERPGRSLPPPYLPICGWLKAAEPEPGRAITRTNRNRTSSTNFS